MNISYPSKLIEKFSHGKSSSALIKTGGSKNETPIGCIPTGSMTMSLEGFMSLAGMEAATIDMSIDDGEFKTVHLSNPIADMMSLLTSVRIDKGESGPIVNGIDHRTVVTYDEISVVMGYDSKLLFNVIFVELIVSIDRLHKPEAVRKFKEFYSDVFGEAPSSVEELPNLIVVGLGTDGVIHGKNRQWLHSDINEIIAELLDMEVPHVKIEYINEPTKLTLRSSGLPDDIYSKLFVIDNQPEASVSSCSASYARTEYTCIPTVKTFVPTAQFEMNDGYGGYWMKIRLDVSQFDFNTNQIRDEVRYVYRVVTTGYREYDYPSGDEVPYGIIELPEDASATQIARAIFNIANTVEGETMYSMPPVNDIGGFGYDSMNCNLIAEHDETSNQIVLAGMFDRTAVSPPPDHITPQYTIYDINSLYAMPCVTKITLEPIENQYLMPYYAKCYVTEQFGEPIVIESCAKLVMQHS